MQITGGRIIYGRTVQPARYESKKAEVELTFVLAEGEELDDKMDLVSELAMNKAHEMVGLPTKERLTVGGNKPASKVINQATRAAVAPKEKTKAEMEAEATAKADKEDADTAPRRGRPPKKPPAPPADDDGLGLNDETETNEDKPEKILDADDTKLADDGAAGQDDPLDLLDDDPTQAEESDVTDEELLSHVTKKNGAMKAAGDTMSAGKIRRLVGNYVAPPGQLREIPVDKRRAFLLELEALK